MEVKSPHSSLSVAELWGDGDWKCVCGGGEGRAPCKVEVEMVKTSHHKGRKQRVLENDGLLIQMANRLACAAVALRSHRPVRLTIVS